MNADTQAIDAEHGHGHDHGDEPHVLPISVYLGVWGALVVLTAITVGVSRLDFGAGNTVVAMIIATIKASLVGLYFMHLRYDKKFNAVVFLAGLLFVSIFFFPTLIDVTSRGDLDPVRNQQTPVTAPASTAVGH